MKLKRVVFEAPEKPKGASDFEGFWEAEIEWENGDKEKITGINIFSLFSQIDSKLERLEKSV